MGKSAPLERRLFEDQPFRKRYPSEIGTDDIEVRRIAEHREKRIVGVQREPWDRCGRQPVSVARARIKKNTFTRPGFAACSDITRGHLRAELRSKGRGRFIVVAVLL